MFTISPSKRRAIREAKVAEAARMYRAAEAEALMIAEANDEAWEDDLRPVIVSVRAHSDTDVTVDVSIYGL